VCVCVCVCVCLNVYSEEVWGLEGGGMSEVQTDDNIERDQIRHVPLSRTI
jgi:hypothetical protein